MTKPPRPRTRLSASYSVRAVTGAGRVEKIMVKENGVWKEIGRRMKL